MLKNKTTKDIFIKNNIYLKTCKQFRVLLIEFHGKFYILDDGIPLNAK
jgi:hypothetical protein